MPMRCLFLVTMVLYTGKEVFGLLACGTKYILHVRAVLSIKYFLNTMTLNYKLHRKDTFSLPFVMIHL